jgi:hypothetical protein
MTDGHGFLQHVLGGITAFAEHQLAEHRLNQERLAVMRESIERVVDASEPRIRLVGDYAEKLVDAVETALVHCEGVLRQVPPALALGGQAWARDPRVNAFFATADDLRALLSGDLQVRAFFRESGRPECFAWMLMAMRETETFGTALQGEMLVREVRQTRVSFSEHRLFFPAADETELRKDLKQRMLVFLATRARDRIVELRMRRDMLEEQRRQLRAQFGALRGNAHGPRPLPSSADPDERRLAELGRRLDRTEQDLADARKPLSTLDDYLEQVRQVLGQPEAYLRIRPLSLRLNRLGIKLDDDAMEPGETITLVELTSLGEQRIGMLVRFAREELEPSP